VVQHRSAPSEREKSPVSLSLKTRRIGGTYAFIGELVGITIVDIILSELRGLL
jgi:hypothetical protein